MKPRVRRIRQVLGTCVSALIVMLSVAVPVLERSDVGRGTAFESQHDPATCAPGHNHTLCTQVGASHALPSRQDLRVAGSPFTDGGTAPDAFSPWVAGFTDGHPTRAPPSA